MRDKEYIAQFVNNIMEDNLSDARESLKSAIAEKIKMQMKGHMKEDTKGE